MLLAFPFYFHTGVRCGVIRAGWEGSQEGLYPELQKDIKTSCRLSPPLPWGLPPPLRRACWGAVCLRLEGTQVEERKV